MHIFCQYFAFLAYTRHKYCRIMQNHLHEGIQVLQQDDGIVQNYAYVIFTTNKICSNLKLLISPVWYILTLQSTLPWSSSNHCIKIIIHLPLCPSEYNVPIKSQLLPQLRICQIYIKSKIISSL